MQDSPELSRRRFLTLSGAAAGASALGPLLSACSSITGGNSGSAKGSPVVAVECDEGQNTLPFGWFNPEMKSKLGVTTSIRGLPFVGQYEKIVSELITHSNVYDVLVFPPQMIGDFVSKGFLRAFDTVGNTADLAIADVLPVYRDPVMRRNGKIYAAMYDGDTLQLTYRTDLFAKAGITKPPATWAEYLTMARELNHPPNQYGTAFYGQRGFCYAWWANIFAAYGGRWFDVNMTPQIASDAGVRALETLISLKAYSPPNILQIGYPELNAAYLGGSTAMVIQWDDLALKAEDPTLSKVVGKNAYAPSPTRTYQPYSRVMAISAFSSNPKNAFKVIQYMNSAPVSSKYVYDPKCGEDPYRISQLDPTMVKSHLGQPTMPAAQATSYVDAIKACLEAGYPELSIPGAPRYLDFLDLKVNEALSGQSTPIQALRAAETQWNSITSSLGQSNQVKAYADWVHSFQLAGVQY